MKGLGFSGKQEQERPLDQAAVQRHAGLGSRLDHLLSWVLQVFCEEAPPFETRMGKPTKPVKADDDSQLQ